MPSRRDIIRLSTGAALAAISGRADAQSSEGARIIESFANGALLQTDGIILDMPDASDSGANVLLGVEVESAMAGDDLAEAIVIVAPGNPRPHVATFHFTEMSGRAAVTTRIRLAQSQEVVALTRMKDGSVRIARNQVTIAVGGCDL